MTKQRYDEITNDWSEGNIEDSEFIARLREHVETSLVPQKATFRDDAAREIFEIMLNKSGDGFDVERAVLQSVNMANLLASALAIK